MQIGSLRSLPLLLAANVNRSRQCPILSSPTDNLVAPISDNPVAPPMQTALSMMRRAHELAPLSRLKAAIAAAVDRGLGNGRVSTSLHAAVINHPVR